MLLAILTMHLLDSIKLTAEALTLLSLLLFLVILTLRVVTGRNLLREEEFRRRTRPVLQSYLAGGMGLETILGFLGKDRHSARTLLMEEADGMEEGERDKLRPLFSGLSLGRSEIRHLGERNWMRRLRAAERLAYLGEEQSIPPLINALRDDALDVRLASALSLAMLGCEEAVVPIIRALDLQGEISQRRIVEILSVLGGKAKEPLLRILGDPDSTDAELSIAARTAGLQKIREAAPDLIRLLGHRDRDVRLNAVRSLGSLGDASAAAPLAALAEEPGWEVRSAVMSTLGRLERADGIPLLVQGLGDPEWWVRYNAAESLHHLGKPGITALREAAAGHADAFARDMSRQVLEQHDILSTPTKQRP
jgi:HEAT repeat protein